MKKLISLLVCVAILFTFASCAKKEIEKEDFLTLDNGNISVVSLQGVSGLFVEKGNQDEVKNVAALIVKNNSDRMLEYCVISFRVNDYERADFNISALPAGESVIVMETLARTYSSDDKYAVDNESTIFSYCDSSLLSDVAELKTEGSDFMLKNRSDKPVSATVVYKYYKDGMYYGGIAFRGKFENVAPGETMKKTSNRFNEDCRIVNITVD